MDCDLCSVIVFGKKKPKQSFSKKHLSLDPNSILEKRESLSFVVHPLAAGRIP